MKIEMTGIKKAFGSNHVLKGVNFTINSGEVHALMGENGAGKSTLMNILTGLLSKDDGSIKVDGTETSYSSALEAEHAGISFIHQEMNNFPDMSVVDNMFLNKELKTKFGLMNQRAMIKQATEYLNHLGAQINVTQKISNLTVGQQQMVEIAKSLMTDAKIIIMDEPTAALTTNEIKILFKTINELKAKGVGFIYISHRMEELWEICDTVTVMRDGVSINTYKIKDVTENQIVHDMVGRDIGDYYPARNPKLGPVALKAENLCGEKFKNISFEVHEGEVLGFSGLMGAGRTETMRALFGIDKLTDGKVLVHGKEVHIKNPSDAVALGIGFLTEDRKTEGLVLDQSLRDNIALPSIEGVKKHGIIDEKTETSFVNMLMKRLTVKAENPFVTAGSLSGGNQQKVVLAKWVGSGAKILILDEPTRGVDVGAKKEIYELINQLTDRHVAVIMISSDLPEVLSMSDRIEVLYEGKQMGIVDAKDANQEKIMKLATGGK
ncbi:D-xylose ABC transporter ATP-binding protein [Lactobacillus jensenii]|uniref:sugar ABC transporter ATP-binding protein n=1 Tax=Lactobacillus jensenii TaxID=109790 RepID=UPI000C7BDBBC|nr:sugar ABC transporter ATP-binding protein [Lactobacillus jensenii]MCF1828376.1 sugar ABC transporter ATP-binding protein [Lactobacillus jensenii]MDK8130831.1 sugar ABC transporter ATP-binding protein [Lactobacillus jensenii]PLA47932.1 D-xylose ABC transporter ATP-binding protein [Lactobacillus jensenii]